MEEMQKKLEEAEQRVQSLEEEKDKKREKKKKKLSANADSRIPHLFIFGIPICE